MAEILKITSSVSLIARVDGLLFSGVSEKDNLSVLNSPDPALQALLRRLPSLISDGYFETAPDGLFASIEALALLENESHDPLEAIFEWSPYTLRIQATGTLGFSDFKFIPRFYLGKRVIPLRHVGIFGWRSKSLVRLPACQAAAIHVCEEFNSLPDDKKDKWAALKKLHELQLLAQIKSEVQLDTYLASEQVIMPATVSLGVEDDGRFATAYPKIEGVPESEMRKQFLNISEVQGVYDLEIGSGRKRIVISPDLQNIFRAIKRHGFGMSGPRRESFYRNPRSILPEDESYNPDLIELVGFGPRVKGIGYPQFVRAISSTSKENWFNRSEADLKDEPTNSLEIECEFLDGNVQRLEFENGEKAQDFIDEIKTALASGQSSFEWENNSVPVSRQLLESCESALGLCPGTESSTPKREKNRSKSLLIHTNEETIEYKEEVSSKSEQWSVQIPKSLRPDKPLMGHQKIGIHWLQNLVHHDLAKGSLLADEMGLGKTLQLLSFAAWCIESEFKDQLGKDTPPYDPILIVAPLILVENWAKEIETYFDGGVFQPIIILHGQTIKTFKCDTSGGRELEAGTETLDLERIKRNRVVITNYDTVKNYQYSFAKIPWSIVIVDEAQEIKEPSTAITHALKALNPLFRIASTGTPVETSLTNLWSIMDFVQAGNRLGSLNEFNKEFGKMDFNDPNLGEELRERLGYNQDNGLIKRRTKKEALKDLPEKHFVVKECDFDDAHRSLYLQVIESVKNNKNPKSAALQGLHQISFLSQHPFLLEDNPFRDDHREYLHSSSKLTALIEILNDVKSKGEKALIFTRSRDMQSILKLVIDREFGLDVKIINGSTTSRHQYVSNTRSGIIESYSKSHGFQVLLLSPEVAGVGLTITAANHVIHYGRWWNPAKENQATDRAYRIGQKRPVYVYHLLYKDPKGEIETFDEKLHRLLRSREDLADNFLAPSQGEGLVQEGLTGDIFGTKETSAPAPSGTPSYLSSHNLRQLTPYEFEAISALILSGRFSRVVLTPKSRDGGVDVIGISASEITLIQCKHRFSGSEMNAEDAITELIDGQDYYREHIIPKHLKSLPIKLLLIISGRADKETQRQTKAASIELLDGGVVGKLLEKAKISLLDVKKMDASRISDLDQAFD